MIHAFVEDIIRTVRVLVLVETIFSEWAEALEISERCLKVTTGYSSHASLVLIDRRSLSRVGTGVEMARRCDEWRRNSTHWTTFVYIGRPVILFIIRVSPCSDALISL